MWPNENRLAAVVLGFGWRSEASYPNPKTTDEQPDVCASHERDAHFVSLFLNANMQIY